MKCQACGTDNEPGRRYCGECGGRLGRPCPACHFHNAFRDKHCGGCGRPLHAVAVTLPAAESPVCALAADEENFAEVEELRRSSPAEDAGVSQSEIDGLFENMLEEDEPGGAE